MQKRKSKGLKFSVCGEYLGISGNIRGIVVLIAAAAGLGYVAVPNQTGKGIIWALCSQGAGLKRRSPNQGLHQGIRGSHRGHVSSR